MALFDEQPGADERTEEASQTRRDEWKREGRVAQSRELGPALVLLACGGVLWGGAKFFFLNFARLFESLLEELSRASRSELNIERTLLIFSFCFKSLLFLAGPVVITAFVLGALVQIAQVGFVWTSKPFDFDLNKLNPLNGLQRLLSVDGLFDLSKALIKFVVVGALIYFVARRWPQEFAMSYEADSAEVTLKFLGLKAVRFLMWIGLCMLLMAIVDFGFQKFRFESQIKMTKQEAREDRKMNEGDPQIKARIRALQRQASNRKMVEAVKKADVVVTNPTHIAVALIYDRENMFAPRVVAKGADFMAQRIKEIARENGVPCVENVPLARALFKALKVGQFISRDLYNAVAEVLAYVYRLKGKGL